MQLSDFGLCKPPALSKNTFAGTPIYMAPEIIEGGTQTTSVDIFAFGILLWYICEGKGNHPQYVVKKLGVHAVLDDTVRGKRPERLPQFDDGCWQLMTNCWAHEAACRPDIRHVIAQLQTIIAKL